PMARCARSLETVRPCHHAVRPRFVAHRAVELLLLLRKIPRLVADVIKGNALGSLDRPIAEFRMALGEVRKLGCVACAALLVGYGRKVVMSASVFLVAACALDRTGEVIRKVAI